MSIITTHPPKSSTSSSIEEASPSYVLQLTGAEGHLGDPTDKIEIGSQPVMIGGGPRCALRLNAPGTKPVHCVVSLGEEGPVVRRWADETLLNGETFTEALLADGDCLSIGTAQVEFHCLCGTTDEATETVGEDVVEMEEASEELSDDPGAIEWTPNAESPQADPETFYEPQLQEEPSDWRADGESEASVQEEEPIQETDEAFKEPPPFAAVAWDAETDESVVSVIEKTPSIDSVATIAALRNRLSVRAERLRRVVILLRNERTKREQQADITAESVALIEQLQADLARAEHQVVEGADSLTDLQKELATANELIETLEASLHDAIEATANVADEPSQEPVQSWVDAEEEPEVDGESSPWPRAVDSTPEVSEQIEVTEPESLAQEQVDTPVATEDLWGIERLSEEPTGEVPLAFDEPISEEPSYEPSREAWGETPTEASIETPAEELTGSLDDVLLPGETHFELTAEPEEATVVEDESPVTEATEEGNSVLASLMTLPSTEAQESSEAPVEAESFIDRFAHLLPEESEEEATTEPALPGSFEPEASFSDVSDHDEEEEESLDDYMKKMMDRIRGEGTPATFVSKVPQPVKTEAPSETASVAQEAAAPEPELAPIQNLDEMKRSPTRELGADLGELRQLANQSARRAIDVSETKDRQGHAATWFAVAGIGATCGLLACLTAPSLLDWQFFAGVAGVAGGGYLGYRTLKVIQRSASLKENAMNEVDGTGI